MQNARWAVRRARTALVGAAALGGALASLAGVVGCGGSSGSSTAVLVSGHRITRATIDQAMYAEVASSAALEGHASKRRPPVPPDFTACISYLRKNEPKPLGAKADSTSAQLKERCQLEYEREKLKGLYFWIPYQWLQGEAAELGIKTSDSQIAKQFALYEHSFPSKAAFRRYLALTTETRDSVEAAMRTAVLSTQIQRAVEAREGLGKLSAAQRERRLRAFGMDFEAKWKARTDCKSGYVVQICRQYKPPSRPSPIVPPSVPLTNLSG